MYVLFTMYNEHSLSCDHAKRRCGDLTGEAKNTFYIKTFLLPGQNMFSTKKILFVTRVPENENRPNEGLYINGVNGRSRDKKMG